MTDEFEAIEKADPLSDPESGQGADAEPGLTGARVPVEHYGEVHADLSATATDGGAPETVNVKPTFPISIAAIGAPGSGKQAFGEAFADLTEGWFEENGSELRVLGNPGRRIEGLGQAVGFFGDYREHLMAFFFSLEEEMVARSDGVSYIVNGTVLGNLAHAGVNYETVMLGLQSSGLVTPETQVRMQQLQATMTTLTFLMENFAAKFAFLLPLAPLIEVPGQEPTVEQRHGQRVNAAMGQVLQGFGFNLQVLDQPTAEDRAQAAFDTIRKIMDEGVDVPRELAEAAGA